MSFLKPESLKKYVEKIDEEIQRHLEMHWHGKEHVMVCMRTQSFDACKHSSSCILFIFWLR